MIKATTGTLVGYGTLAEATVRVDELVRRAPRYPSLPAPLSGRLAGGRRHRARRSGERLLFEALARAVEQSAEIASYVVVVAAKDAAARRFHKRYGFVGLASAGNRLLLPWPRSPSGSWSNRPFSRPRPRPGGLTPGSPAIRPDCQGSRGG